jgi:hypothetical protein
MGFLIYPTDCWAAVKAMPRVIGSIISSFRLLVHPYLAILNILLYGYKHPLPTPNAHTHTVPLMMV